MRFIKRLITLILTFSDSTVIGKFIFRLVISAVFIAPFTLPSYIIAAKIITNPFLTFFGLLCHIFLFLLVLSMIGVLTEEFYKLKVFNILLVIFGSATQPERGNILDKEIRKGREFISGTISSFLFLIYWYATTYMFIANNIKGSFDKLDSTFIDYIYLSFTAISVGPSGLNPTSAITKFLVMTEIAFGLFYIVLVFASLTDRLHKDRG